MYEKATIINAENASAWFNLACAYSLMGEKSRAVGHLAKAIQLDEANRELAKTDTDFDPVRNDPEFRTLVYGE